MNEIGTRIYEIISNSGITKSELAKRINVSQNTIQYWKNENAYPSLAVIEKICDATGITTEQFFHGIGSRANKKPADGFIDSWRFLNEEEKSAVRQTIIAFRKDKAVRND